MGQVGEEAGNYVTIHIQQKLKELAAGSSGTSEGPYLYRVSDRMRKEKEDFYDPKIVAIGPYHHDKPELQDMQNQKLRYLQLLLDRRTDITLHEYVSALSQMEERARKCYLDPVTQTPDEFVEMLLLDGCFILEYLRNFLEMGHSDDHFATAGHIRRKIRRDFLLLENQIPFFVLVQLFDMTKYPNSAENILDLALCFLEAGIPGKHLKIPDKIKAVEIDHLLGLVHYCWTFSFVETICTEVESRGSRQYKRLELINTASELQEGGVHFRKSNSNSLFDVNFKKGFLNVPYLSISWSTESTLRNLITYEQCHPRDPLVKPISDYMTFMDCLVNSPKDVQLLRRLGIIRNKLSDDAAVCALLNSMSKQIVMSSWRFCYTRLFLDLNSHCGRRRNVWMATLKQNYFNSPWALISFLAAVVLILLTVVQTVFSVLSYTTAP